MEHAARRPQHGISDSQCEISDVSPSQCNSRLGEAMTRSGSGFLTPKKELESVQFP